MSLESTRLPRQLGGGPILPRAASKKREKNLLGGKRVEGGRREGRIKGGATLIMEIQKMPLVRKRKKGKTFPHIEGEVGEKEKTHEAARV